MTELRCCNCQGELSWHQKMYSLGRCPLCGVKHPSARTIVKCDEVVYRLKYTAPWWKFWAKPEKVYKADIGSKILKLLNEADANAAKQHEKIKAILDGCPPYNIEKLRELGAPKPQTTPPAP